MKVSFNWLKQYVPIEVSPAELERVLPMIGLEVEEMTVLGLPQIENLVVGEVLSREQHPDADRLGVCQVKVSADAEPQQIVCGATNYKVGDRIPVALPGCVLPGDFKIKQSKLRGVESNGMMCSAKELGLGEDHSGLLILDQRPEIGMPINDVFTDGDTLFELELTANRGDCLSHIGVARELAAYYGLPLNQPELKAEASTVDAPTEENVFLKGVSIDTDACKLYTAWTIQGVKIGPSPEWMQKALTAVGLRPINNVVDVTNYVLMEGGQPLHAFDAKKIQGGKIIVRQAAEGEKITTLDEKEHTLTERMMVIADESRPLVIAGVMGSVDAEVDDTTVDVVLESAWFVPGSVRWTTRRLNLHTDSSNRFTRDVDPAGVDYCARRAIDLILETAGGQLVGPCVKVGAAPRGDRVIKTSPDYVRKVCGFEVEDSVIRTTFENLGFKVEQSGDDWSVTVGSFRPEVDRPIDLVEEFIRLYGTDKIPAAEVAAKGFNRSDDPIAVFNRKVGAYLVGQHFFEASLYSLTESKVIADWHGEKQAAALALDNPLTSDMSHFRASLLPGLLNTVKNNLANGNEVHRLFETGRVFRADEKGRVNEILSVAFVMVQESGERSWLERQNPDFYTAKSIVENVLTVAGIAPLKLKNLAPDQNVWEAGHGATMGKLAKNKFNVEFGAIKLSHIRSAGMDRIVYAAELLVMPAYFERATKRVRFESFASFPTVSKDLALLVDEHVAAEEVRSNMAQAATKAIQGKFELASVDIFDVYQGKGLPENKKSLGLSMLYRSGERTLTDKEVNTVFDAVQKQMTETHGYEIRS